MSAGEAAGAGPAVEPGCACTNISLMQLFHELKQKFPGVPDHAVSGAISACRHDRGACLLHLEGEARAALTHAYHASSSAAARGRRERRISVPSTCPNQPIARREFPTTVTVESLRCDEPQRAKLSTTTEQDENADIIEPILLNNTEDIESSEDKNHHIINLDENTTRSDASPITINIDSCIAKISETPSDVESDDTTRRETPRTNTAAKSDERENTNYKILKSSKVRCNLNEKLENGKEKPIKVIETAKEKSPAANEKPKRPCTLEFIKPLPEFPDFKQQIPKPGLAAPCRGISPTPCTNIKQEPIQTQPLTTESKETTPGGTRIHWPEQGYPVNLSVNVNCHMDIPPNRSRTVHPNVWSEDYDSPRAFTSVNLTVCTPTSAMQSPLREAGGFPTSPDAGRGFEGHVTVTVSPSTARPPRRRAPPPPATAQLAHRFLQTPSLDHPPTATDALIARQRARKKLLDNELSLERTRLARLARETAVLAAPLPSAGEARRLKDAIELLREECQRMTRKLDQQMLGGGDRQHSEQVNDEFYRNLYTGQRPPSATGAAVPTRPAPPVPPQQQDEAPSWQCHVCTFRNHGLLNKCEECDMPRIVVVRAGDGEITVRLMPGRRKIVRSWVL